MKIIIWTEATKTRNPFISDKHKDRWACVETLEEAEQIYNQLLSKENTYSASICSILESTDYYKSAIAD